MALNLPKQQAGGRPPSRPLALTLTAATVALGTTVKTVATLLPEGQTATLSPQQ